MFNIRPCQPIDKYIETWSFEYEGFGVWAGPERRAMAGGKKAAMIFGMLDAALLGVLNFVRFLARFLPPQVFLAAADYIGYAMYYTRRGLRKYVLECMRESLPDVKDERELERIAKEAFSAPIKSMLDLVLMESHFDTVNDKFIPHDEAIATFDREMAEGRGVLALSFHIGGVGISFSLAANIGRYLTPVVLDPHKTPIPRYLGAIAELGQKLGTDPEAPVFWAGDDTVARVSEHLRRGKCACMTFDLAGGTVVDFFGRPTAIASGLAHIACNTNAILVPGYIRRNERPLEYQYIACPEFSYTLNGDREADVEMVLKQVVEMGEMLIRRDPGQWIGWLGLRGWRRRAEKMLREENKARA
jgi:lauroyl/myristoyl acyltransferase